MLITSITCANLLNAKPNQSHKPLLFLLTEMFCPLSGELQIVVWLMGFVVQIQTGHSLLRHGPLNLSSFMPLIKWRYCDDIRPYGHRCLQRGLVISSIHSVACVVVVPRPDGGVHITRSSTRHKQQVVLVAESFDSFPVLVRRSKGEAIRSKVGVHAVKPTSQDVLLVTLFHYESDEDAIVRSSSQTERASDSQQLSPGLRWGKVGVVHIKEWKDLPSAGLEPVESPVCPVSVNMSYLIYIFKWSFYIIYIYCNFLWIITFT